jgi:hypothetical protein
MTGGTGVLTTPLMFLSSYAPLLALLAIRFDGATLKLVCAGLALLGVAGLLALMHFQHQAPAQQGRYTLTEVRQAGEGAASYLAGYLLPFVTIGTPSAWDLVAFVGFFLVAYAVTAKTGIIQVNPTLFLVGYTIYQVTDSWGSQRYLLSRTKEAITSGSAVKASRLSSDILLLESVEPIPEK